MKLFLTLITIMLLVQACARNSTGPQPGGETDPSVAPDFTVETLDHGTFKLSDQRGKVVYVFFIGYSCPPCISASPDIEMTLRRGYGEDKLAIVGVDVWDGSVGQLSNFRIQTGVTFPLGLNGSGVGGIYGAPNDYSVLIDKSGRKVYESAGANVTALKKKIDELIQE